MHGNHWQIINTHVPLLPTKAALSHLVRRYNSAICCSKTSRDALLIEALDESDKSLESLLQHCGSVRVYKMADGADG